MIYEHKLPAPVNFAYPKFESVKHKADCVTLASSRGEVKLALLADSVFRVTARQGDDVSNPSQTELDFKSATNLKIEQKPEGVILQTSDDKLVWNANSEALSFVHQGVEFLRMSHQPFGVSGARQMAIFDRPQQSVVYGLGEKMGRLDRSGRAFRFWNVDVLGDHPHHFAGGDFDPTYVSVPWYISKYNGQWFGVLLNNPYHTYCHAGLLKDPSKLFCHEIGMREVDESVFTFAANRGELDFFILPGPSLKEVVQRLARLTGTHDVPSEWALGYHQCRWSYETIEEVERVADDLHEADIPVSAMWLDIDYMDGFRVFTWGESSFGKEERTRAFKKLRDRDTHIVTIVDPGIKRDPGYEVYDEFSSDSLVCTNSEGVEYIGSVWPGATVFPDFSLETTQTRWAKRISEWVTENPISGIWIDMNDPSTGPLDIKEMMFGQGTVDHEAYHNQYANLMAKATYRGIAEAKERTGDLHPPFVLTRSATTGIQRYAAVWTGDNVSNEVYMRDSIAVSLGLSLSGVAFNGPDVGGFCNDATEELVVTWTLAGCLFPFFRNHSCQGTMRQEPTVFSEEAVRIIRDAIQLRQRVLPYMISLFENHQQNGDPVMRPLAYEFDREDYEKIDDQYMLGSDVLVAPFLDLDSENREVVLPPGKWFGYSTGEWYDGDQSITISRSHKVQIWIKEGSSVLSIC